jgi:protease secretion system outer membrane protein
MFRKKLLAGLMLMGVSSAYALNLQEAYELALSNDPVYRSALKEYEAGQENESIGRAAVLPKVAANYNKSTNQATQWGAQYTGGPNVSYNWSYPSDFSAVQLTQPLFSLEALARWRQGSAQTDFSKSRFLFNAQDLLIRVLQSYTDYLYSMDQYSYQKTERDSFAEQFKVAQKLYEKGEGTKTDALEAESALYVSDAKLVDAADAIEYNKRKLDSIIGKPIEAKEKIALLSPNFPFINFTPNRFADWKEKALATNLELKAATNQIEIAKQEYKKNDAGHYPVMNMVAAVTTQNSNTVTSINQTTNQNYVGIQLSLPLYSGNEVSSRAAQAYANYEKSQADYDVAKDKVLVELRKQFDAVHSGAQKISALVKAKASATLLVEAMKKSVQAGEKINLDVLVAQKNLYVTSRDLAQAKYNYLIAYLKVKQLTGELEVDDFQKVATYFK